MKRSRFFIAPILLTTLAVFVAVRPAIVSAAPMAAGPINPPSSELHTDHYDLYVEGLDAAQVGGMLEQLHAQLHAYFGAAPQGRLPVAVYATRERWAQALRADGQFVPPTAGGYYAPPTRKAYLWAQPSAYFTRQLLLHEVTHQFHWLTSTGNSSPTATWYYEGLAEYFGMHNWDGKRLQTGVVPAVTLEDYPSAAVRNFDAAGQDLQKMLLHANRPESWALVHFLLNEYPDQFRKLSARLDRQEDLFIAWEQVLGSDWSRLSREFGQWLKAHAQPWQVVWVSWQQRGNAIESQSQTSAVTVLKETPKTLTVELEPQTLGGAAGIVFAYKSARDFYLLQVRSGEKVCVIRRHNDAWVPVSTDDLPPGRGLNVLSVTQDENSTMLWANGRKVATVAAVGQVGLNTEGCRALFRIK